jgi:transcription antitermination factor NusG
MAWYAIHTRSRHENKVEWGLTQKAIHVFLPKMEVWSKRKDRRKKISIPMFPGYLFVDSLLMDNSVKLNILKTVGVVRILGKQASSEPLPVPDDKIEAIQRLIRSNVEVKRVQYPMVGHPAQIVDGPLKDIEGIVLEADYEKEWFVISVELLQRAVAIKLAGFNISKL